MVNTVSILNEILNCKRKLNTLTGTIKIEFCYVDFIRSKFKYNFDVVANTRTALLTNTFSNSEDVRLTRELTVV